MTKAHALKLARERWGDRAHLSYDRKAGTKETKAAAHAELKEHRANKPNPVTREWRDRQDELVSRCVGSRCNIGELHEVYGFDALCFGIRGAGDSWDEACRKAGLIH